MTYFAEFDNFAVRTHNEGLRREMSALRIQKRVRQTHKPRSSRPFATIRRWMLHRA